MHSIHAVRPVMHIRSVQAALVCIRAFAVRLLCVDNKSEQTEGCGLSMCTAERVINHTNGGNYTKEIAAERNIRPEFQVVQLAAASAVCCHCLHHLTIGVQLLHSLTIGVQLLHSLTIGVQHLRSFIVYSGLLLVAGGSRTVGLPAASKK